MTELEKLIAGLRRQGAKRKPARRRAAAKAKPRTKAKAKPRKKKAKAKRKGARRQGRKGRGRSAAYLVKAPASLAVGLHNEMPGHVCPHCHRFHSKGQHASHGRGSFARTHPSQVAQRKYQF